MSIEGLGKKFQDARLARGLTLDEAARMTKIRPTRLAEIEADDFSQFPSLAYAKGFLLIYGKFLDIDVSPYLEAFETSEQVTVDGYSYLQDHPEPKPRQAPVVRRPKSRSSPLPFIIAIVAVVVGFGLMKLILDIQRLGPQGEQMVGVSQNSPLPPPATPIPVGPPPAAAAEIRPHKVPPAAAVGVPSGSPAVTSPPLIAGSPPASSPTPKGPEVRRAEPVRAEDLATARVTEPSTESSGANRVAIKPLRKTYIKVVVDNETVTPAFERWISPTDGTVEFRGQHIAVRVLDRDAVQIKKNGKLIADDDTDVSVQ